MSLEPSASPPLNRSATGRVILIRHGSTAWSSNGRHTGRTDLPLTPQGEADAAALAPILRGHPFGAVLTSPLVRAERTSQLAGLSAVTDPDLQEWDYGGYEGLTTAQIRDQADADWTVFTHGVIPGPTPGETLAEVAGRTNRVLTRVARVLDTEDVVLVAHGHLLRVLATVYLGLPAQTASALLLDAGSLCVLEMERETPAIRRWNVTPHDVVDALA